MSLRKVSESVHPSLPIMARVYRDAEWGEYRVRFYAHGRLIPAADYHTDDLVDALATELRMLREPPKL